jgi:hypothetical protein
MSEGSWVPKTWAEALPYIVWGILAFAFGFEGVGALIHGEFWPAIFGFGGMAGLAAMLIHWTMVRQAFSDVRWLVAAMMVAVIVVTLSPYVEQKRWPFSLPKSPVFGKTELDQWRLVKELHNKSPTSAGRIPCAATISFKQPNQGLYDEMYGIMYYSGWLFKGTPLAPSFPAGISLFVASDSGVQFKCASLLKDFLRESVGFEAVSLRVEPTEILKECNSECVDLRLGDVP